jgi:uncharacterized protein YuzE
MGGGYGLGLSVEYSRAVDAMYIWLRRGVERTFGRKLDDSRYVDFGEDGRPIGIELLNVSRGVETEGLPEREAVEVLLARRRIRTFA